MITRRGLLEAALAAAAAPRPPAFARGGSAGIGSASDVADRIAASIERYQMARAIPGAAVHVRRGRDEATRTIGTATFDGTAAITQDTLFRQYCMTKPVTAIALARMVVEGRISPDDRLTRWFPRFAETPVAGGEETAGAGAGITIAMLASHMSGISMPILRSGPTQREQLRRGLIDARLSVPDIARMTGPRPASTAEFADRQAGVPLVFAPGAGYEYGLSYHVLGAVMEKVADMALPDLIRAMATGPLGMDDTTFTVAKADQHRMAGEYFLKARSTLVDGPDGTIWTSPPPFWDAGSGLASTPRDYARLAAFLSGRGGGAAMDHRVRRIVRTDHLPRTIRSSSPGDADAGYGWGGYVQREGEANGRPRGTYGWSGIGGTSFWCDPANDMDVVVMAQFGPAQRLPLRRDAVVAAYA